ncbi:MAG: ATPase [Bacteroidales bacterium]
MSDRTTAETVTAALSEVFPGASVSVGSDLLGSVRALFGDEKGIACIIGTGSNSCLCDRGNIVRNIPPLGFILGDEGSGAYLGKMLLSDYLKGIMPELISESFRERYHTDKNDVISRVYRGEFPSRYVAGFVTFISENLESAYLYEMVLNGFRLFLQRNVLHYEGYPSLRIAFTGSVAWYFREILIKAMGEFNLSPGDIVKDPADRILEYHIKKKRG